MTRSEKGKSHSPEVNAWKIQFVEPAFENKFSILLETGKDGEFVSFLVKMVNVT